MHVYEFFSQNQKFSQLNTEVRPVKEHVLRKQKNFQTDLNLRFFAITAIFAKNAKPFCVSFFHFSSKRFKTVAFIF